MDLLLCPISCYFSVAKLYPTLWDLKYCRITCFPVLHHLLEFAPIYVHWVSDAIQLSHPLSPPSPLALSLSQHQGLFQWVGSSYRVAKYWSFSFSISPSNEYSGLISFRTDWLISLQSKGLSRVLTSNTVWKQQFFGTQGSLWSNSHIHTWLLERP